ncbi:MAG: N-acetyltransferase family protein [Sulfitobacter sp.]
MKVSAARAGHAPSIARIWNDMIRDTLSTFTTDIKTDEEVGALIHSREGTFWVAENNGVAGFVTFGAFRAGPGYAGTVEHTVILDPSAQCKGWGSILMDMAEAGAQAIGAHVMVAGISSANPGAVAFHGKRGFVQTAYMPQVGRKAGRWLDLILMQKTISTP